MGEIRINCITSKSMVLGLCVPPDVSKEHHCCADRPVSPGALRRHQRQCLGDQSSEEKGEDRGKLSEIT